MQANKLVTVCLQLMLAFSVQSGSDIMRQGGYYETPLQLNANWSLTYLLILKL